MTLSVRALAAFSCLWIIAAPASAGTDETRLERAKTRLTRCSEACQQATIHGERIRGRLALQLDAIEKDLADGKRGEARAAGARINDALPALRSKADNVRSRIEACGQFVAKAREEYERIRGRNPAAAQRFADLYAQLGQLGADLSGAGGCAQALAGLDRELARADALVAQAKVK